jgi:UDP-N-acetylmuramoyl-L-alanyl-D-glutamate--2,6-diaminopimelate ligase
LSDIAFATSDNPRFDDPEAILDEVFQGIPDATRVRRLVDRREAIRAAVDSSGPDDLVVVAGKGHEDYQTVGTEKHHFDDVEELDAAFRSVGVNR